MGGKDYGPRGKKALEFGSLSTQLSQMWEENPETTLRLIFFKGDCRGGSKEKRLFLVCFDWLVQEHPQVARRCLPHIPDFRSWKDLVRIAQRAPALNQAIASLFARQLEQDLQALEEKKDISLCAKWVPSEKSGYDKANPGLLSKIRELLTVNQRDFRVKIISPLRKHLDVVERKMCAHEWDQINYNRVPSVAMNMYKKVFDQWDGQRYQEWIQSIAEGKGKVNVGQLYPHELVSYYLKNDCVEDSLTEAQWSTMVENTRKLGKFGKSLAIVDTSGSMSGTPLLVAISLGLLLTECADPEWRNLLINFDSNPKFFVIEPGSLRQRIQQVRSLPWGGSTDIDLVFTMLLARAQERKLPPEQMPDRLYIFTDMQFNQVTGNTRFTGLERIQQYYQRAGYPFPEIICWNLRETKGSNFFCSDETPGVCMLSGFSQDILSGVLEGGVPSPAKIMRRLLYSARYDCIGDKAYE